MVVDQRPFKQELLKLISDSRTRRSPWRVELLTRQILDPSAQEKQDSFYREVTDLYAPGEK